MALPKLTGMAEKQGKHVPLMWAACSELTVVTDRCVGILACFWTTIHSTSAQSDLEPPSVKSLLEGHITQP